MCIVKICSLKKNPIEEIFDIKQFVMEHLKEGKSSPQYQLQKYYPKIFKTLKNKQFELMQECVIENLNREMKLGLYRKTLNVNFIPRIYFHCMAILKDNELFVATFLTLIVVRVLFYLVTRFKMWLFTKCL